MQDTFLHEVFHAIVHVMDLKETETEENYVRRGQAQVGIAVGNESSGLFNNSI